MKFTKQINKPLWSISDGCTQSILASFLECRKKAELAYKKGWESAQASSALAFGTQFHDCLDRVYHYFSQGIKELNYRNIIDNVQEDYKMRRMEDHLWTVDEAQNHELHRGFLETLLPAYLKKYEKEDRKKKWIAVETEFNNEYNSIKLKGKYDRIAELNGEKWIYETKTKSRIDPNIELKLGFDLQNLFYLVNDWLTTKTFAKGVVYDIIQKPALRQGKAETLGHFIDRVRGDIDDSYFLRIRVPVSEEKITYWMTHDLVTILNDFKGWAEGLTPSYKNPTQCESRFGLCKFIKVCALKDFQGLQKKTKIFSELEAV